MKSPTESNFVDQNFGLNTNGSNNQEVTPLYFDIEDTVRVVNNNHVVRGQNWQSAKQRKSDKKELVAGPSAPEIITSNDEHHLHNTQ